MTNGLVDRWLAAIEPFDVNDLRGKYLDAYSKRTDLPEDTRKEIHKAIDSINFDEVNDRLKAFAAEHFSEEALLAAVTFFESPQGKQYLTQRETVMDGFLAMFGSIMGDAINKAMGGGPYGG